MEQTTYAKQTDLTKAWNDTEEQAREAMQTFKAETNKTYTLTFSDAFVGMVDLPKRDAADQIMRDAAGNALLEKKDAIILWVDNENGKPMKVQNDGRIGKRWIITSKGLRASLKLSIMNGNILRKKFQIQKSGEKFQTKYSVSEVGDR